MEWETLSRISVQLSFAGKKKKAQTVVSTALPARFFQNKILIFDDKESVYMKVNESLGKLLILSQGLWWIQINASDAKSNFYSNKATIMY